MKSSDFPFANLILNLIVFVHAPLTRQSFDRGKSISSILLFTKLSYTNTPRPVDSPIASSSAPQCSGCSATPFRNGSSSAAPLQGTSSARGCSCVHATVRLP
ncbi:hypothetical protein M758_5G033700 [Ceratodon purpureus]|nr:hypothetical protein M758_5G033700 [Ceratodon purpureus]